MKSISVTTVFLSIGLLASCLRAAEPKFVPPASPRATYNFNPGWRFIEQDVPGAEAPAFDDSKWDAVSTPHTYNDVDTFDEIILKRGERTQYTGPAWYRKHFKLPAEATGEKVFIEFEGIKQAARFYVNGKPLGLFENGVTACGIDASDAVHFGDADNVLAVRVDNSQDYKEEATHTAFEWMSRDFNANYGGINRDVRLHLAGKVYQTLPLYENLKTTGVYVYAKNVSVANGSADVTVESQVKNESGDQRSVDFSAVVVDADGVVRATLKGDTTDMVGGEANTVTATGNVAGLHLWSDREPYLYDVYSILTIDGKVADVVKTTTGFRKTDFRGGAGKGGVYLNDRFDYLKGFAQRSTNEWAALGQAVPDWLHDYTAACVRGCAGNLVRWTHVAPMAQDVRACDRFGIVQIVDPGDKEKDVQGRQWEQRLEAMRDTILYYRNSPSVLFWEAGNNGISAEHMKQMQDLHQQWDPSGGRAMGCRSLSDEGAIALAQYYGTMVTMDDRVYQIHGYTDAFRGYSDERRDRGPLIESEDFRDEGARRFWDAHSPPSFGFHKKPDDTWDYNSETFALAAIKRYHLYASEMITNPDPKHSKWSGYCDNHFTDTNSFGRQFGSEVARVSGKMDAMRLPKEIYYARRVMQTDGPDLHILGHWTYPKGTKKTVYVISNAESVELFVNGASKGKVETPADGYVFAFPDVAFEPGTIKAVGSVKGKTVCEQEVRTAGAAKALKLTPITAPGGLRADGSDVALVDVEVVDEKGERCPTDEARVDFACAGPAIWRGGYNSGKPGSTNNLYLDTECGINRVAVRSTAEPGKVTITAKREGLEPATLEIESKAVPIKDGLEMEMPPTLLGPSRAE